MYNTKSISSVDKDDKLWSFMLGCPKCCPDGVIRSNKPRKYIVFANLIMNGNLDTVYLAGFKDGSPIWHESVFKAQRFASINTTNMIQAKLNERYNENIKIDNYAYSATYNVKEVWE